jgi:hypothetical protein
MKSSGNAKSSPYLLEGGDLIDAELFCARLTSFKPGVPHRSPQDNPPFWAQSRQELFFFV